ncbi:MAG: hypothetical protein ACUVR1_00715 [Fimbriimonadales bacterium]
MRLIWKLYFQLARWLSHQPTEILLSASLEQIAAQYTQYSYIGNRKTLSQLVLSIAEELYQQWLYRGQDLSSILDTPPSRNGVAWASWWYGRKDWQKDSGAFPDFVLACDPIPTFGNGAILELKDSRGTSIASFNSTLPTARKLITTLLQVVHESVQRYESLYKTTCPAERDCFYLIRTGKGNQKECRLSLVQGTFFETIPTEELLKRLWSDLLTQSGVSPELRDLIVPHLAQMQRAEIAKSRIIQSASAKPRLRVMGEVVSEANPHNYHEISALSFNLIVNLGDENSNADAVATLFEKDGLQASASASDSVRVQSDSQDALTFSVHLLHHKRNGTHVVVQMRKFD